MRAWVAVALLGAAGCGNASEPSPVPVGQAFELSVAKTQDIGDGLRVTFNSVSEDSRCPTDVTCVWAGNAALQVTVALSGNGSTNGVLNTSRADEPVRAGGFEVRVRDLRPAPLSTRTIDPRDYVATLVVVASK